MLSGRAAELRQGPLIVAKGILSHADLWSHSDHGAGLSIGFVGVALLSENSTGFPEGRIVFAGTNQNPAVSWRKNAAFITEQSDQSVPFR